MSVCGRIGVALLACALFSRSAPAAEPAEAPSVAAPAAPPHSEVCPGGDDTVCGRQQFEAGTRAFELGNFEAARAAFEAALALRPHPVIRYNLALCWARSGKPRAALEQLELVLGDAATDTDLRARSERELASAKQALAHVTLLLSDAQHDRVEVDNQSVAAGTTQLALDPGPHHIRIISGDAVVLDQDLDLTPGESVELRVGGRIRQIDVVMVPDTHDATAAPPASKRRDHPRARPVGVPWFVAAVSATALLGGLTVWSGIDTQNALSDYKRRLPTATQADADQLVSDGHARELRTNVLLSGSILGAVGSAVLGVWFVDFAGNNSAHVAVGPGSVRLDARF